MDNTAPVRVTRTGTQTNTDGASDRTVGRAPRKPSPHGLSHWQVKGTCSLVDNCRVLDTRTFNDRHERQAIFKLWRRKYGHQKNAVIRLQLDCA